MSTTLFHLASQRDSPVALSPEAALRGPPLVPLVRPSPTSSGAGSFLCSHLHPLSPLSLRRLACAGCGVGSFLLLLWVLCVVAFCPTSSRCLLR